jgi:hypothetical protein
MKKDREKSNFLAANLWCKKDKKSHLFAYYIKN